MREWHNVPNVIPVYAGDETVALVVVDKDTTYHC